MNSTGRNGFTRSVTFAAVAAIAVLPWLAVARAVTGPDTALATYLVAANAAYIAVIAPSGRRRLTVFALAAVIGCLLAIASRSWGELALGLAIVLAVARSGFLYRLAPIRGAAVELVLAGGGLLFARFLAVPSLRGLVLALWGYLLVQSVYFLVGGLRARLSAGERRDPFAHAYARALELLD